MKAINRNCKAAVVDKSKQQKHNRRQKHISHVISIHEILAIRPEKTIANINNSDTFIVSGNILHINWRNFRNLYSATNPNHYNPTKTVRNWVEKNGGSGVKERVLGFARSYLYVWGNLSVTLQTSLGGLSCVLPCFRERSKSGDLGGFIYWILFSFMRWWSSVFPRGV